MTWHVETRVFRLQVLTALVAAFVGPTPPALADPNTRIEISESETDTGKICLQVEVRDVDKLQSSSVKVYAEISCENVEEDTRPDLQGSEGPIKCDLARSLKEFGYTREESLGDTFCVKVTSKDCQESPSEASVDFGELGSFVQVAARVLDAETRAFTTEHTPQIIPKPIDQVKADRVVSQDGIESWKLERTSLGADETKVFVTGRLAEGATQGSLILRVDPPGSILIIEVVVTLASGSEIPFLSFSGYVVLVLSLCAAGLILLRLRP